MNILLTAVGSAAAQAVQKALKKAKHKVYGCDIYPKEWLYRSEKFADVFRVPLARDDEFVDHLSKLTKEHDIDMIIPLTDPECDVLAPHKAAFAAEGVIVACLGAELQVLCRNKARLPEKLKQICSTIPCLPTDSDFEDGYPYLLKPISGRSSQHQLIARSKEELKAFRNLRADYIIQPFIEGDIYTVDVVRDTAGNCMALARKELLRTVNGLGTSVKCYKKHELEEICAGIMQKLDIVGCVNIEFIGQGHKYHFLEVNPRFSGGVGFSLLSGYDFINAHVQAHLGKEISLHHKKKNRLIVQGYQKEIKDEKK